MKQYLMIKNQKGCVRSIDVANKLNFSKPSVSVAMKNLRKEGYIIMNSYSGIVLTEKGHIVAESVYERHRIIAKALITLGVDEETAYEDNYKIEHDISDLSFIKIKEHLENHSK
mgnify:FL=1